MDPMALLVFAGALLVAAASPGPGIAAIVARVIGHGTAGALAFTAGIAFGDVVWLTVAVMGLAVLAKSFAAVLIGIKYMGAAYLLYLAWSMWTAPLPQQRPGLAVDLTAQGHVRLFLGGLAVTLGNPKVIVFYLALLPSIVDLEQVSLPGWALLSVVTLAVLGFVFGGYVLMAARARRLLASPRAVRMVQRTSAGVMAGAAAAVATR
jgi:threonine/homoserine/homoserine lactone efflux protein